MTTSSSRARTLLDRARTTLRTETLERARERFSEAASEFEADGDIVGLIECWIEEARALASSFRASDVQAAHAQLDRATDELEEGPNPALEARLHHVRGYARLRTGQFPEATESLRKAESLYCKLGDRTGEARVVDTLGVLHEHENDREAAALCLARSQALKTRLGDQEGVAISLGNLGRLALRGGKPREAEGFFRLDLEIAQELHDTRGEAMVRTNLAEALIAQGHAVEGARTANQALALSKRLGNDVGEGFARLALSAVALVDNNEFSARTEAETALACFARAGVPGGKAAARLALSRVESTEGNHRLAAALALASAHAARQARQSDAAIDALFEAHKQLAHEGMTARADRALARAQHVAATSHQPHLVERVETHQAEADGANYSKSV